MVQISIDCPICSKKGIMEIDDSMISQNERGITTISVSKIICEHSFIAYIDNKFDVRDTFITDLTLTSPTLELEIFDMDGVPDQASINILLIMLNIHPATLTNILHAFLCNEKILLIHDLDILHKHIRNFFDYIFTGTFKINFTVMDRTKFRRVRKLLKDYLILDDLKVLNDKNRILKNKKLEVERNIVHSFFSETADDLSIIKIKNEISKAFKLSNDVATYISNLDEGEALDAKDLTRFLENLYNTKISSKYLNFLIEIVRTYYKINFIDAADCLKFLWD